MVAVHHSRKNSSEDFLEEVSGTLGLAGSVDTVIALKRARTRGEATPSVTGRDVEEMVYAVNFANGKWAANGMNLAEATQRAAACNLGDGMRLFSDSSIRGRSRRRPMSSSIWAKRKQQPAST